MQRHYFPRIFVIVIPVLLVLLIVIDPYNDIDGMIRFERKKRKMSGNDSR
jgi:hypothetical protein